MRIKMILLLAVMMTAVPPQVFSQIGPTIGLYSDPEAASMYLIPEELYTPYPIYVVVLNAPYISGVEFSAPLPSCFQTGPFLGDETPFPLTLGNSQQGVSIAFGTCVSAPVHVLTIVVFPLQSLTTECFYPVLPAPYTVSGKIELVDCNNNILYGIGLSGLFTYNAPPGIGMIAPFDGAVDQPTDTQLHWWIEKYSHGPGEIYTDVYFGMEEDPPIVAYDLQTNSYNPGSLQPETTYYWKLHVVDTAAPEATTSPIWSFTTEGPVPVGRSTWGEIKALYD